MKDNKKSKEKKVYVTLSWDDCNYACKFKVDKKTINWQDLTRDEQIHAIGAMVTMSDLFSKFLKKDNEIPIQDLNTKNLSAEF